MRCTFSNQPIKPNNELKGAPAASIARFVPILIALILLVAVFERPVSELSRPRNLSTSPPDFSFLSTDSA